MPAKKGSHPVYVEGPVYAAFRARLELEGWTWGITKKVEGLLKDYVSAKTNYEDVSKPIEMLLRDQKSKPHGKNQGRS